MKNGFRKTMFKNNSQSPFPLKKTLRSSFNSNDSGGMDLSPLTKIYRRKTVMFHKKKDNLDANSDLSDFDRKNSVITEQTSQVETTPAD